MKVLIIGGTGYIGGRSYAGSRLPDTNPSSSSATRPARAAVPSRTGDLTDLVVLALDRAQEVTAHVARRLGWALVHTDAVNDLRRSSQ